MVRIGSMKEYITIQVATPVSDGQGGNTVTWATLASEWAKATQLSYDRGLSEGGVRFTVAVRFDMRYCSTHLVGGEHQIVWDGNTYTIHSVVENDDRMTVIAYR